MIEYSYYSHVILLEANACVVNRIGVVLVNSELIC
jgi:hypothetical protein